MFGDIIYKLDVLYSPFLVQITNCLFKFDRNVAIIKKIKKNRWIPPILSNMLDNCRGGGGVELVVKIGEKIG